MAEISWTDEAQRWLQDISEYIAADNPQAAARTIEASTTEPKICEGFRNLALVTTASSRNVRILLYGHYRIACLVKDDGKH